MCIKLFLYTYQRVCYNCMIVIRLCVLPSAMSIQPSFCHRCCLGNIKPADGDEWSQNLISRFKGITIDAELQMKVNII